MHKMVKSIIVLTEEGGDGVFSPGDQQSGTMFYKPHIARLNSLLKSSTEVHYLSRYAKTNNGVYAPGYKGSQHRRFIEPY